MPDTPIATKLQLKPGRTLCLVDAPEGMDAIVGDTVRADVATADIVVLFAPDRAAFDARLPQVSTGVKASAILWLAYPKLTSKLAGDLSRNLIHEISPAYGRDTVSQIAIDDDWSAMRLKAI